MRQLVQARFAFGKYFVSLLVLLNLATLTGFCVVDATIGGQALSAVMEGETITATVGIVIISLQAEQRTRGHHQNQPLIVFNISPSQCLSPQLTFPVPP